MNPPERKLPASTRVLDIACRSGYRTAYQLMKAWWFVRRPRHDGACAAVWHRPRILLVRCSYRPWTVLPGGFPAPGETLLDAAVRELAEEAGVRLEPAQFRPAGVYEHRTEYLHDHIHLFEAQLSAAPTATVDRREIVWAGFVALEEALTMNLLPPVRAYLEARASELAVSPPAPVNDAPQHQRHGSAGTEAHPAP